MKFRAALQTWMAETSPAMTSKRFEPTLNSFHATVEKRHSIANNRELTIEIAETIVDLAQVSAQRVDTAADVSQVFQHDAVCLGHANIVTGKSYRENFLYFNRCGMMLSCPSLRILSAS